MLLVLENYTKNNKIIKYIEKYHYISYHHTHIKLTIFFNLNLYTYFNNVRKTFRGKFFNYKIQNDENKKFNFILELYDTNILEFLGLLYENKINHKIIHKSILYNNYRSLYQILLKKENAKYYYI